MTVAFVESSRIVYCSGKDLREEERDDSREQLKNVRCVWCGSQSADYFEYSGSLEDILKTKTSDPAWFEEVLEKNEKSKEVKSNVYYTETSNIFPIIVQKPISLTPLFYLLKKIAEEELSPEKKKVVGRFFGEKNAFVFATLSFEGKVEKFERKTLRKEEIQKLIEKRRNELEFFIIDVTVSEADFYRLAASKYKHLLTKETTLLNDELKEVFFEVDEEKIFLKSLALSGALVLTSSLLYLAGSVYSYNLTNNLKQVNQKISHLKREILREQQKKLFSYAKFRSTDLSAFFLPFPQEFLTQLKAEGKRAQAVFDVPVGILTPDEEKEVVRKALKNKCQVKRLEKFLKLTCSLRGR